MNIPNITSGGVSPTNEGRPQLSASNMLKKGFSLAATVVANFITLPANVVGIVLGTAIKLLQGLKGEEEKHESFSKIFEITYITHAITFPIAFSACLFSWGAIGLSEGFSQKEILHDDIKKIYANANWLSLTLGGDSLEDQKTEIKHDVNQPPNDEPS